MWNRRRRSRRSQTRPGTLSLPGKSRCVGSPYGRGGPVCRRSGQGGWGPELASSSCLYGTIVGMGSPFRTRRRLDEPQQCFHLRLPAELHAMLAEDAAANEISLNTLIVNLVREYIGA